MVVQKKPVYRLRGIYDLQKFLPPTMGVELEKHIHIYCTKYMNLKDVNVNLTKVVYNTKLSEICFNLEQENSPYLLLNILQNELLLSKIPYATADVLNPLLWDPIIKRREYCEYKRNNMATTDAYKCRKCGERKSSTYQLQTRSADEPMTIFITCENCKHSFKIG